MSPGTSSMAVGVDQKTILNIEKDRKKTSSFLQNYLTALSL